MINENKVSKKIQNINSPYLSYIEARKEHNKKLSIHGKNIKQLFRLVYHVGRNGKKKALCCGLVTEHNHVGSPQVLID